MVRLHMCFLFLLHFLRKAEAAVTITGSQEYGIPGQPLNLTCTLTTGKTVTMSFLRTGSSYSGSVQVGGDKCYNAATSAVCTPSVCSCINDGDGKGSHFSWIITPNSSMHLSTWTCKDFENNESEVLTLRVAVLVASVTLQSPPAAGSNVTLNEGSSTNLVCVTSACRPSASVQWYIGNTNYTSSSSQSVNDAKGNLHITTSTLTFTPNRNMNGKSLKCSAYNYGDTANTVSYDTQLNVRYPSENKATLNVSRVDITEGQSVYILCEIKGGNPKASITWDCFTGTTSDVSTADDSQSVITVVGESSQDGQSCTCRGQHNLVNISQAQVTFTVGFAPKEVTLTPSGSQIVFQGRDTQPVTCSAKCNPQCTYSWSFKGVSVTSGAKLRLNGIRSDQEGLYTCTARNTYGGKSADVTILVYHGPGNSVTLDPSQEAYIKNENDILPSIICAADCKPNCSYVWMLAGNKNTSGTVLSLSTLEREEQGTYGCVARNIVGESVKTVTISVQYGPADSVTLNPSNQGYTKNENDILPDISCGADCRPNCSYVWMLPGNTNRTGPVLSLSTLNRDEQGTYKCVARNIVGESIKTVTITVRYGPGNSIQFNPASNTIIQVENTTLTPVDCSADCRPQCTTTWTIDTGDGNLPNPLTLGQLKRNEAGQYTCTATNVVSSNTKSLIVHVKYPPIIKSLSYVTDGPNVSEYLAIKVRCKVDSYPRSTIKWTYESGQSLQTDSSSLNSTFTLHQANCFDTGFYSCSASNEVGAHASKSIIINVLCHPRLYGNSTDLIGIGNNDNMNASVTFVANPSPKFTWVFQKNVSQNFTVLNNNSNNFMVFNHRKHVVYTSEAIRNRMREEDFGFYTLEAVNGIGRNQFRVHVVPKRRPDSPDGVSVKCLDSSTAKVTWVSKFDGGDPQQFHILFRTNKDTDFKKGVKVDDPGRGKASTQQVNNLDEGVLHFFTVNSSNRYGEADLPETVNCTTKVKAGPDQSFAAVIGGAAGGGLALIVIVVVIVIVFLRRKTQNKGDGMELMNQRHANEDDDPEDGMKPNIIYESAGPDYKSPGNEENNQYAEVRKDKKSNDVYAEVNKPKKQEAASGAAVYAEVMKPKENKLKGKKAIPKKADKKGKANGAGNNVKGDVYENVGAIGVTTDGDVYENTTKAQEEKAGTSSRRKNKDGLVYIDVVIKDSGNGAKKGVIHGIENRNDYAEVDFTRHADPLPSDDEDEITTPENTDNRTGNVD